jgi:hypothetical protein
MIEIEFIDENGESCIAVLIEDDDSQEIFAVLIEDDPQEIYEEDEDYFDIEYVGECAYEGNEAQ